MGIREAVTLSMTGTRIHVTNSGSRGLPLGMAELDASQSPTESYREGSAKDPARQVSPGYLGMGPSFKARPSFKTFSRKPQSSVGLDGSDPKEEDQNPDPGELFNPQIRALAPAKPGHHRPSSGSAHPTS